MERKGILQGQAFSRLELVESKRYKKDCLTITTSGITNWMDPVGTTSKSDVKQKEKKP